MNDLKIGSTIWRFDENRRVYPPKQPGDIYPKGGPIYREHWVPVVITGETKRSWITAWWAKKAPKSGLHPGWAFSEREVDDACWVHVHKYNIVRRLELCRDAALVRKIAEVVGYKEEKQNATT